MEQVLFACLKPLIPLMVEHSQVDTVLDFIRIESLHYLTDQRKMSADEAGAMLNRSSRWVYMQRRLEAEGGRKADRAAESYRLHMEVLEFFAKRTPQPASVLDCLMALEEQWPDLDEEKVVNLIEAFCKLGQLHRVEGRYQWIEVERRLLDSSRVTTRLERVIEVLPQTIELQLRYVLDEETKLKRLGAEIDRSLYPRTCAELTEAVNEVLFRAVVKSDELEENGQSQGDVVLTGCLLVSPEDKKIE